MTSSKKRLKFSSQDTFAPCAQVEKVDLSNFAPQRCFSLNNWECEFGQTEDIQLQLYSFPSTCVKTQFHS